MLIDVERHERSALALAFVYFFCVLAAYYVIRPVRDQLGAVGGSQSLILFYAATFVATLAVTPLFGALVARFPRKVFVPAVYLFFIACLLAFVPMFGAQQAIGARVLGSVFFVWVSVFNLFVVSVFWSVPACINVVALGALALFGGPLVLVALVATRSAAYGIFKPSSDSLYTRVAREARYKGKNFIDTAVWRAGDLGVISTLNGLRALGFGVSGLALFSAIASLAEGWFGWRAAHSVDLAAEEPDDRARHAAA